MPKISNLSPSDEFYQAPNAAKLAFRAPEPTGELTTLPRRRSPDP